MIYQNFNDGGVNASHPFSPAWEDLIGAGAILSFLNGNLSPEAEIAVAAFHTFKKDLQAHLKKCSSGKELIAKGFELDVELAAAFNVSDCVPLFTENAHGKAQRQGSGNTF